MEPVNPYARSLVHRNAPDTFKTTYGTSYKEVPTLQVSPVYDKMREGDIPKEYIAHFPIDLSPYPMARADNNPIVQKKPYKQMTYDEEMEYQRMRSERSRFEEATLKRDSYREPLPPNRQGGRYDELERYETARGERQIPRYEMYQQEHNGYNQNPDDREKYIRSTYDDLVPEGPDKHQEDLKVAVCNKCFKERVCMNRLSCNHQFCDECMSKMHGSDNPFRDSIRWHYCCDLCHKWTAETKLARTDPYGRRMMKFHDIGYFKTS